MRIGIVGPGRAGLGLALALGEAGHDVRLHGRGPREVPEALRPVYTHGKTPPWIEAVTVVMLAVQDRAIAAAAEELATARSLTPHHTVLHLSGIQDTTPLDSLRSSGAALGVMHPLQAIAPPGPAPDRLQGALAAITGDPRATEVAETIARGLGMIPVAIAANAKAKYHAAAVIASNFSVVLAAIAEALLQDCGMDRSEAHAGIVRLMEGTLANVRDAGPRAALTGPVVRGDEETIRRNLEALPPEIARVYEVLAEAARRLAGEPDGG